MARKCLSFYDWCIINDHYDLLSLFDETLNQISPKDISYCDKGFYYFKCPSGIHNSELYSPSNIYRRKDTSIVCRKCNSFAQWLIDTYGENALHDYWDYELNNVSPWDITSGSHETVYIKCQKTDYHGSYPIIVKHFTKDGVRCAYCFNRKVHPKDSFAQFCIDNFGEDFLADHWDYNMNTVSPWEISPKGKGDIFVKCVDNNLHPSFPVNRANFLNGLYRCPTCFDDRFSTEIEVLKKVTDGNVTAVEEFWQIHTFEDITGATFNKLTVIGYDYQRRLDDLLNGKEPRQYWICECDCNTADRFTSVLSEHLKSGKIKSCGCWKVESASGENNWNWKGGVNSEHHKEQARERRSNSAKEWRRSVLNRDNHTCQCCGKVKHLHVHHLYSFASNVEYRCDVDNGIVLCDDCHHMMKKGSFHNVYGTINNTPEQLREYVLNKSNIDIYLTHPEIHNLINKHNNTKLLYGRDERFGEVK